MNLKYLSLLILFTLSHITTFAFDFESKGINYTITSDSTVEVSPKEFKYKGTVNIPSYVTYQQNRYKVTRIGKNAFSGSWELLEVTLPETVTEIATQAFSMCGKMKLTKIPSGVKRIEKEAFMFCHKLALHDLPESLEFLGERVFYCSRLPQKVVLPASLVEIENSPFGNGDGLAEIIVAEGNPNYISYQGVLYNRDTTVLLNYPVSKADLHEIPLSVERIDRRAFNSTKAIKEITIPSSVNSIGVRAFEDSKIEKVVIEHGLELIDSFAFNSCRDLHIIQLPNSLKLIQPEVFYACSSLKSVKLPISIPHIPEKAFMYCGSLESIEIPSSVVMIDKLSFSNCKSLQSVSIPGSVIVVGYAPFYNCTQLKKIYLQAPTPYQFTNKNVFTKDNLKNVTLVVPKGKIEEYRKHPAWNEIGKFEEKEYFFQITLVQTEHGKITLWDGDKEVESGEKVAQGTILKIRIEPEKEYYPKSVKYNYTHEDFAIPTEIELNMDMVISVSFEKMQKVLEENLAKK